MLMVYSIYFTGIGGFVVRLRGTRNKDTPEDGGEGNTALSSGVTVEGGVPATNSEEASKPRRKPNRRRARNKLMECYPSYLQVRY